MISPHVRPNLAGKVTAACIERRVVESGVGIWDGAGHDNMSIRNGREKGCSRKDRLGKHCVVNWSCFDFFQLSNQSDAYRTNQIGRND